MHVYCDKATNGTSTQWASSQHGGINNIVRRICEAYKSPAGYRRFVITPTYYDPDSSKLIVRLSIDTRLFTMNAMPSGDEKDAK